MIDHISIFVNDLTKSRVFYEKAFTPFGFTVSFGEKGKFWAFDIGNGALFEIIQHPTDDKLTELARQCICKMFIKIRTGTTREKLYCMQCFDNSRLCYSRYGNLF